VLLVAPEGVILQRKTARGLSDREIEQLAGDVDVIIREGFKDAGGDRIEVFRYGVSGEQPLCMHEGPFIALVSDRRYACGIPWFDLNDALGVSKLIAAKL
jgi:molybdopterin-guanine dinucleotide biosynthesis protein